MENVIAGELKCCSTFYSPGGDFFPENSWEPSFFRLFVTFENAESSQFCIKYIRYNNVVQMDMDGDYGDNKVVIGAEIFIAE